jgi:hypothetical protein
LILPIIEFNLKQVEEELKSEEKEVGQRYKISELLKIQQEGIGFGTFLKT